MAGDAITKIGFVSGGSSNMPHYGSFTPLVPKDVELDFQGLNLYGKSLYEIADKKSVILGRIKEFIAARKWDGLILTAAPTEVLNPGIFDDLKAAVTIPCTTALNACVAALRTYSAPKVLLLTPFDAKLNDLIVAHLAKAGVTAISPNSFDRLDVPKKMTADEVFDLTKKNLAAAGKVDAIYFQGAVLDPIKCLERVESELKATVIASNPAMLWYVLSKLGYRYPMSGYGRLLREWPAIGG
jgi:Arylmalonate decarboxylase